MRTKLLLTILLTVAALSGDAVAWLSSASCGLPGTVAVTEASCCCGPDACPAGSGDEPGLRSSCCDMRSPTSGTESSPAPREAGTAPAPAPAPMSPSALALDPPAPAAPRAALESPASLHAPPLYTLFRSYRI